MYKRQTLTGVKGLAKTSATPGRTRLLNFFAVTPPNGPELVFVDLPGYGYAKLPKEMRKGFGPLIDAYIETRDALALVVVIVDARRGPEDEELDMVPWLEEHGRRPLVVLTKADKLPKAQRFPAAAAARKALGLKREPLFFSATDAEGIPELWRTIVAAVAPAPQT